MIARLFFLLLALISLCFYASHTSASKKDSLDYKSCTALVKTDATSARTKAEQWVASDGSAYAYHCLALAEYKLKNFAEAAQNLSKMRALVPESEFSLRHDITLQQVRAWKLAGTTKKALEVISPYINELRALNYSDVDLAAALLMRSGLYNAVEKHLEALQDADHALTLNNTDPTPILISRAKTYLLMGEYELAQQDIDAALENDKENKKALALKEQLIKAKAL